MAVPGKVWNWELGGSVHVENSSCLCSERVTFISAFRDLTPVLQTRKMRLRGAGDLSTDRVNDNGARPTRWDAVSSCVPVLWAALWGTQSLGCPVLDPHSPGKGLPPWGRISPSSPLPSMPRLCALPSRGLVVPVPTRVPGLPRLLVGPDPLSLAETWPGRGYL